ncbi:MAG: hypothetical protein K9G58_06780 [Bacteroidales bacterium]|nr:hypothetical protein [Bacteroidales bacterium]MCF8388991.1 hypothetical protein [Bacteroidales bacterium]MCF8397854.1 hypothetical protein [Bacteroidales bacterium]
MKLSVRIITIISIIIIVFYACENKPELTIDKNNASVFLNQYFTIWNEGKIDSLLTMTHGTDSLSPEKLKSLVKGLKLGRKNLIDKHGGIKEIMNIKIDSSVGPDAYVSYDVKYFNGLQTKVNRVLVSKNGEILLSLRAVQ